MERFQVEFARLIRSMQSRTWQQLAVGFGLYLLPVVLFAKLASEVREQETLSFDEAVLRGVHSLASPMLDSLMPIITNLGYTWTIVGALFVIMLLCLRQQRYKKAMIALIGIGGSAAVNLILKALFQRDRPDLWQRLVTENSHSFPSGHAMASASLAMVIVVLLWPTKCRMLAIWAGLTYVLFIGFTRLYLGVHYPTDIIAGWLMASSWVIITAAIINRLPYFSK